MFVMASVLINICACIQGWENCVCLDMNAFYLGLVPEDERCRVENLEPFDEYEVSKRRLEEKVFCIVYGIAYINALKASELQVITQQCVVEKYIYFCFSVK